MSMFQTLKPKPKAREGGAGTCLLLDVSGSMGTLVEESSEDGYQPRRIEVLFKAVRDTPECAGLKPFVFSESCHPIEVIPTEEEAIRYPVRTTTDMAGAFYTVKNAGYYSAILVTDGEPNSAADALNAAVGMKLGIIYIGNPPVPDFLRRLAEATEGTFALADMRDIKQLEDAIVRALPPPDSDPNNSGGAINL